MSRLSLPQPPAGWASVWWELAIVTVGVLIALCLGAVAADIGWRFEVGNGRDQVRHEVAFNIAIVDDSVAKAACVERRLAELGGIMAEASQTRRLPPIGRIYRAPSYSWPTGIWESQIAAQTAAHYPAAELAALTRLYRRFAVHKEADDQANEAWTVLNMMVGPGRPLDATTEGALYEALTRARSANCNIMGMSSLTKEILADTLGQGCPKLDPENRPAFGDHPICQPVGSNISESYGKSPAP